MPARPSRLAPDCTARSDVATATACTARLGSAEIGEHTCGERAIAASSGRLSTPPDAINGEKRPHVQLHGPALTRGVSDPPAIGRDLSVPLRNVC
jgi:hypothetical protein